MSFAPSIRLDLVALEDRVLGQWKADDVFAESSAGSAGARNGSSTRVPRRTAVPASTTSGPGCSRTSTPFPHDAGKYVARKAGWDCHGLPVEVEVEKELGFSGKPQIEDFGIEAFNQRCRESVQRYVEDWSALTSRIGMWLDLSDAYTTMSNEFIESVWWQFHELWDKELIYEGSKVVPTAAAAALLSSHEPASPSTRTSPRTRSTCGSGVDADFDLLVWTTTPGS